VPLEEAEEHVLGRDSRRVAPEGSSWVVCVARSSVQELQILAWKKGLDRNDRAHFSDSEKRYISAGKASVIAKPMVACNRNIPDAGTLI
jgi:hypothetical protein